MTSPADRVFIAHHKSPLGSALLRMQHSEMHTPVEVITAEPGAIDWSCSMSIRDFLRRNRPTQVVFPVSEPIAAPEKAHSAGAALQQYLVGGVNLIEQSHRTGIKRLLVVSGAWVYPNHGPGPFAEEDLLTGSFHPMCETLGIATLALVKMCERYTSAFGQEQDLSYRSMVTVTPFGVHTDDFDCAQDVIIDMLQRLHEAKEQQEPQVQLPYAEDERREFLYADDVAQAALYMLKIDHNVYMSATAPTRRLLNAGYGAACSMSALAHTIAGLVGYTGDIAFQTVLGQDQKTTRQLDSHRLRSLGWRPSLEMEDAMALTYFHTVSVRRKQQSCS